MATAASWSGHGKWSLHIVNFVGGLAVERTGHKPTKRSYAAGFRSSRELSSFKGVRHFWQYIVVIASCQHASAAFPVGCKLLIEQGEILRYRIG